MPKVTQEATLNCEWIRTRIKEHVEGQEFDLAMVITANSHTDTIANWYQFAGHPDTWTDDFKRHLAWRMASATADLLKDEVKNKTRKFAVQQSPATVKFLPDWTTLFWIVVPRSEKNPKRMSLACEFAMDEISIGARWWKIPDAEVPYWGISVMVGPISIRFGRDL